MEDCRSKLAHKLLEMCAGVAKEYAYDPVSTKADTEFWGLWNAANGASARLGLPHHETPAVIPDTVEEFLRRSGDV